jgi:hypothetical protein
MAADPRLRPRGQWERPVAAAVAARTGGSELRIEDRKGAAVKVTNIGPHCISPMSETGWKLQVQL